MAAQLLVLRGVPEDEAEDVRKMLRDAHIDFYETPEGNWGVSLPAIWLQDPETLETARRLLAEYQERRKRVARESYERQGSGYGLRGILDRLRDEPLRVLLYVAIAVAVLYFSTIPFVNL